MKKKRVVRNINERFHSMRKLQKEIITVNNFTYRNLLGTLKGYLKRGEIKILDIGCGVGTLDFFLASLGYTVYCIDISSNAIKIAELNSIKFNLAEKLKFEVVSFPDKKVIGKYDLILMFEVLEHLHNDVLAVKKCLSLLNHKGTVIFSVPSKNSLLYRWGLAGKHDRQVGHLRRYTSQSLQSLLRNCGLNVIEVVKREGILRNSMFIFPQLQLITKFANKFSFIANLITDLDNILLRYGESEVIVVATKDK